MQIRIVEEFLVCFEDRSLWCIGLLLELRLKRLQLVPRLRNRSFQSPLLLAGIGSVLNNPHLLAPKLEDVPNSQAGRGSDTIQNIRIAGVRSPHWFWLRCCDRNRSGSRDFFVQATLDHRSQYAN